VEPEIIVAVAALATPAIWALVSEKMRALCWSVFRRPSRNTVLLQVGGEPIEIQDVSEEERERLVAAFIKDLNEAPSKNPQGDDVQGGKAND
jgi:hypothetical protein